jgi:capsular polysaccharide biosynthesis protein
VPLKLLDMQFNSPFYNLDSPENFDEADIGFFSKIEDWKSQEIEIRELNNVKLFSNGIILKGLRPDKQSFFGTNKTNLSGRELIKYISSKSSIVIEKGIWATDDWGEGYFHWFIDTLQRFVSVYAKFVGYTLLLPIKYSKHDFILSSLKELNINVHWLNDNTAYRVKSLILPPFFRPRGTCFPNSISDLRGKMLTMNFLERDSPKAIYISRKYASKRKIKNEDEVLLLMKKLNIAILYMEQLTWREQMQLLYNSKILISLHGAGLTNMLMMNDKSKILELRMETGINQICYFELSKVLGFEYYYLKTQPTDEIGNPHTSDCKIDISKLELLLEKIMQSKKMISGK